MTEIADDAGQSRPRGVAALIGNLPRLAAALAVAAACAGCQPSPAAVTTGDGASLSGAASGFETVRHRPPLLRAFLQRMPKGGDLHTHLVGAIYAESYIAWAAADGLCVDPATLGFVAPPCTAPRRKASDALTDQAFYDNIIDAMSARNFVPGTKSGHDQFFDTFAKFGPVTGNHRGDMLAEVASRAAAQHITYLEIMETLQGRAVAELVAKLPAKDLGPAFAEVESGALPTSDELTRLRKALLDQGLGQLVEAAHRDLDAAEASKNQRLGCDTASPDPGCLVTIRYLYQTIRTAPPLSVYAQLVLAFELVKAEKRVVGLNMVAPEDYRVARRDYKRHMAMLDFLWHEAPEISISLHAGELTLGLVPPDELRNHIRLAVEEGHAKRLGHAVAIGYEDDAFGLLKELAQRQVDIEINLTSNDQILDVVGAAHPFADYRRAGVPVTISTDDEGVSRSDLTHEYQRAVETYDLGYDDLKTIVRTSIAVSFLAGPSLWQSTRPFTPVADCAADALGSAAPSQPCQRFLAASDRARESWRLENEFASFERLDWRLD